MENECKSCDHCVESKQGIICLNPKSDNFNQKVDLKDNCEYIEFNYFVHPKGSE